MSILEDRAAAVDYWEDDDTAELVCRNVRDITHDVKSFMFAAEGNRVFDFEPGQRWSYNHSAYILAGAVIEKASGMSYADFIEKRIFQPLGMTDSYFDVTDRIIPRRIRGYGDGETEGSLANAPSMLMGPASPAKT